MARSPLCWPLAILLVLCFSAELCKSARLTTILDDNKDASNDLTNDEIDSILGTVSDTAEATNDIVRRFLNTAVGAYPPSPAPPSPAPPAPLDDTLYIDFVNMPAHGAKGTEKPKKPLVWFDDTDFYTSQLKGYKPLQLVARPKRANCTTRQCQKCLGAWKASAKQDTVSVFFKDPVQISKIYIKQLLNPGVAVVQLLKWKFPPEGSTLPRFRGAVVLNQTSDNTTCGGTLTVDVPSDISGIFLKPHKRGSAEKPKPSAVAATAVGGISVTVIRPPGVDDEYGPWIEDITFDGRALYPADPDIYDDYRLYDPISANA
ncbi:hypothetical protein HYH02_004546 [Chlamydomonas schloesseri]|uniref:Uncharacterized protein n=1 Tax=Chlamydomonas schloesseri TaxID=2026947 RepID=A0A835WNZ2_9CHLO|nr:hypothetical protein HYH02_004546 [Chlamydomonas schloesseri]|eukprot:KAG2450708.1 hypothetical protein HYH02_004546 [Chlamydomonas schloesseri]